MGLSLLSSNLQAPLRTSKLYYGAEEDRLHEVAQTTIKVANDPHQLSYPLKEGWWAVTMASKNQIRTVHLVYDTM